MKIRRGVVQYTSAGVALAAVAAGGYVLATSGGAYQTAGVAAQKVAATPSAAGLTKKLGNRTAGAYLDRATGRTVVTVTNQTDAALVRAAGKVPKLVRWSGADLSAVTSTLRASTVGTGTGWGINPKTDAVTVWADPTVRGARLAKLKSVLAAAGTKARLQKLPTKLTTLAAPIGGDAIFGGQVRCSLGFNVTQGTTPAFLTAGHCGVAAKTWFSDQNETAELGSVVKATFPGNDFSLVSLSTAGDSAVDLFNGSTSQITTAADAVVGENVTRTGSTTGLHTGTVTALNATVNLQEGTVTGMIQTTVCAEPGDSGGPLFDGTKALGLTSAGSGDCTVGGVTFFQPVTAALTAVGAQIGSGSAASPSPTDSASAAPTDSASAAPTDSASAAPTDSASAAPTDSASPSAPASKPHHRHRRHA